MTQPELDDATRARIQAEEEYRAQVRRNLQRSGQTDLSLWLGVVGCLLLAAGPFFPMFKAPIVGEINLIGAGNRDGILLVGLATLGLLLTFTARTWLIAVGFVSAGLTGLLFFNMRSALGEAGEAANLMEISWGWLVVVAGLLGVLWAGFSAPAKPTSAEEDAKDNAIFRALAFLLVLLVVAALILFNTRR